MNQPNQRTTPDPLAYGALVLFGLLIYGVIVYVYFRVQLIDAALAFRHFELSIIGWFTDSYTGLDNEVLTIDRSRLGPADLWHLGNVVGGIYGRPGACLLLAVAVAVYFVAPRHRYRSNIKCLDDLILSLDDRLRYTRAYVGRNLPLRDPEFGKPPRPGDMALNTAEWIAAYARDRYGAFNQDLARVALESQLGPVWTGPRNAPPHVRCLFAALTLYANRNRPEADTYAGDLATSLPPGNGDVPLLLPDSVVATADSILADAEAIRPCAARAARHAYTAPAMLACLEYARSRTGVLNSGMFNWLKLVDRPLWYVLVMPCNPLVEGAGARAHYIAETIAEMPLYTPQIEPALQAVCARHGQSVSAQRR
jgi:intracellular multiplication protein IcmP